MELLQLPLVHDGQGKAVCIEACRTCLDDGAVSLLQYPYGNTFLLRLRQLGRHFLSACCDKGHFAFHPLSWYDGEHASPPIDGLRLFVSNGQDAFHLLAIRHGCFKGNTILHTSYQVAAFGKEREVEFALVRIVPELTAHHTQGHVASVVSWSERSVIDREDTTVKLVVVAEIFAFHLLVPEHETVAAGVFVLMFSPVQLPARISTKFVEAAVLNHIVQGEEAVTTSFAHLDELSLHQVSVVVQQFHIKHTTNLRRPVGIRLPRVGREPNGVALEIASVIEMDIHLFLRNGFAESVLP